MPWDLRVVTLDKPPRQLEPHQIVISPDVGWRGVFTQDQADELTQLLAESWEPFSTNTLATGVVVLWLRRPSQGPTPTFEAHGQYL